MEISFIIPVYNGENCILRCIRSIQAWNKAAEIEILVVDDGSSDETGAICDEAAALDLRIRVFHIKNSGQSLARNLGMQNSNGRYCYFADADDWVDAGQIYLLWQKAEEIQADVVMGSYIRVNDGRMERVPLPGEGFIGRNGSRQEQNLYHKIKTESGFGYVWNKLYRKEFLIRNLLLMDDIKKIYMEDQLFNLKLWSKNPVWYCLDVPVYYYETGNVSTTRKAEPQIHTKNVTMLCELIGYLQGNGVLEVNLDTVIPLLMRTFCWSLIKNVEYEGRSFVKIKARAECFVGTASIQHVLHMRGAGDSLMLLPSRMQICFYLICLLLMRWKLSWLISVIFVCFYPLMKKYILATLK